MVEPLRHRQTKGAATDMFYLMPPRHISTLHKCEVPTGPSMSEFGGEAENICSHRVFRILTHVRHWRVAGEFVPEVASVTNLS